MKNSVVGSRNTTVNSLNKMALNPRNISIARRFFFEMRGQRHEYIFERCRDGANVGLANADTGEALANRRLGYGFIEQEVHRLAKDGGSAHAFHLPHRLQTERDVIAIHVQTLCAWRIYLRQ